MKGRYIKPHFVPFDTSWQLITGETLDGRSLRLVDYRGKYLLLNFWGEWCSGCRTEIPALKRVTKNISKSKLQIVSFVYSNSLEQSKKLIKDSSITWPQIPCPEELGERYNISGYPTNILISPNGREAIRVNMVNDKFFNENIH
jgi:thiol-disulfide isomerase/thioredoxin